MTIGDLMTIVTRPFFNLQHKINTFTLESGIDIAPGINVSPGTFGKNNKHSPLINIPPSPIPPSKGSFNNYVDRILPFLVQINEPYSAISI